jgi:hypothetical protein
MGSPPVAGSASRFRSPTAAGSFFPGGSAGTGSADAVAGPSVQIGVAFLAATSDGIDVPAGNECEQGIATVAGLVGLQGSEAAALLLVQAAHQEVNLMVQLSIRVIGPALAEGASTRVNDAVGHDRSSVKERNRLRRTWYEKSWKSFLDAP